MDNHMAVNEDKTGVLEEFANVIEMLCEVVRDITRIEQEKAEAASQGRHGQIDEFLKQEQVYILKLRGLEKKRQSLAEAMGWKDLTFRQILAEAEENQFHRLNPLFTALDDEIRRLQEAKDSSDKIIKVRLRELEYILALSPELGRDPDGGPAGQHFHDRYV